MIIIISIIIIVIVIVIVIIITTTTIANIFRLSPQFQDVSFAVTLPKLERLEASDNKITALPEGFDKLKKLAYLDLTNNEGLTALPAGQ